LSARRDRTNTAREIDWPTPDATYSSSPGAERIEATRRAVRKGLDLLGAFQ